MKKIFSVIALAIMSVILVSCGEKEFAVDGEFTAFELSLNYGVPMYTTVKVEIEDGELKSYYIDARQGEVVEGKFIWNEKTKKELKEEYGMKPISEIDKEWYEQAEALEAFMLENGPDAVTVDGEGYIDNVTGVSVKDGGYTKLAKEALENAKANKVIAFEFGYTNQNGPQFTWVEVTTNDKGKVVEIFLDVVQSTSVKDEEGVVTGFTWNEKSKKELKEEYGMKVVSAIDKEWYEQAAAIEAFILENGPDAVSVDENGYIDNITGVSMKDGSYTKVYKKALELIK